MKKVPVIWLTGLSGAGKSTIAEALASALRSKGKTVEVLDGDVIREVMSNSSFDKSERNRNVKTVGIIAQLLQKHGVFVISAMISPYREARDFVRSICTPFLEVHVSTPLVECERRDVKGLYKKARSGVIKQFTGLDDPYEEPLSPELVLDTSRTTLQDCVDSIINAIE